MNEIPKQLIKEVHKSVPSFSYLSFLCPVDCNFPGKSFSEESDRRVASMLFTLKFSFLEIKKIITISIKENKATC